MTPESGSPEKHWRYRYPLAHRIERHAFYAWEWLTWGPLHFVRRAWCFLWGHDEAYDYSTPEGGYFCRRCMEDYD